MRRGCAALITVRPLTLRLPGFLGNHTSLTTFSPETFVHRWAVEWALLAAASNYVERGVKKQSPMLRVVSTESRYFMTLLQDSFTIFQQARGLSVYTSPSGECTNCLVWIFFFYLLQDSFIIFQQARGLHCVQCTLQCMYYFFPRCFD